MTKIQNLDSLLRAVDQNEIIMVIEEFIAELCNDGGEYDKLTEPQMVFYLVRVLENEVSCAGFNLYFINPSGDYAHETVLALKAIGANKTAEILQKAIDQFPDKIAPKDRDERNKILDEIEDVANDVWFDLNDAFFKFEDNLITLAVDYVKKNKEFF